MSQNQKGQSLLKCVSYGSQNKQPLFPNTTQTEWFLYLIYVYCTVRNESPKIIPVNRFFKWLTHSAIMMHTQQSLQYTIQAPVTNSLQTFHTLTVQIGSFLNQPDRTVHVVKLPVAQLVKTLCSTKFFVTFTTVSHWLPFTTVSHWLPFTTVSHWLLQYVTRIHSTSHPISPISILILSSQLNLGFTNLCPSVFSN